VMQVQVNEKIDLTFSRVLRSVLRQDPDVVLVGEMRDAETAQIGLRAAITGHLVFSTLHTNDAASTPVRLLDMGAPRFMVATALQAVFAQRLVRVVCPHCIAPHTPNPKEMSWLESMQAPDTGSFSQGTGCQQCNQTGYLGRAAVYEMLEMTPTLAHAANQPDPRDFLAAARHSMAGLSLAHNALALALGGRTSLAEALRVSNQGED